MAFCYLPLSVCLPLGFLFFFFCICSSVCLSDSCLSLLDRLSDSLCWSVCLSLCLCLSPPLPHLSHVSVNPRVFRSTFLRNNMNGCVLACAYACIVICKQKEHYEQQKKKKKTPKNKNKQTPNKPKNLKQTNKNKTKQENKEKKTQPTNNKHGTTHIHTETLSVCLSVCLPLSLYSPLQTTSSILRTPCTLS